MPLSTVVVPGLSPNANPVNIVDIYQKALNGRTVIRPSGVEQIASFAFDYHGADVVTMESEATDHWLEDNTAVQDHIGTKPVMVTLRGYTSELSLSADVLGAISTALAAVETKLSTVSSYLGAYTPGVTDTMLKAITQAENIAVQIEQAAARAAQISSFFKTSPSWNKQQTAFAQLSALRDSRAVFTVYTPFEVYSNMVITSLRAEQGAVTRTITDFTVTMKQLQFTNDISVAVYSAYYAARAAQAQQNLTNSGATSGTVLDAKVDTFVNSVKTLGSNAFKALPKLP